MLYLVVSVVSTQELLNCGNDVVFSNTPMLLCDYDALLEHLKLPKEHQNRILLEKKITCGDICFPNESLKKQCTESLRDHSPCTEKKGIVCVFFVVWTQIGSLRVTRASASAI